MSKEFLVLQHVEHEHPGLLTEAAKKHGVGLEVVELWKPYKIPNVLNYQGLIIMGGPMGVYENYPSKRDEIETIKKALGKVPIIGFCLGSQLLAHALGADVHPNIVDGKKTKEAGYYTVDLTDAGLRDTILKGFNSPMEVLQWHGDAFDLPKGATLLATSPLCTNQAFRFNLDSGKPVYGFLFHFEFTPQMIDRQIEIDKSWIHTDIDVDEEKLKVQAREKAKLMEEQCQRLFDNFLEIVISR